MYPNSMLFGGIFAILFVAAMALGVLLALKRGFIPSLVRLGMIAASVLIALLLVPILAGKFSGLCEKLMTSVLGSTMEELAQYSPSTLDLIYHFPVAIIAPLLFIALFYALKWLTLIVFRFIRPLLPSHSKIIFRILGGVAGALGSAVCLWALLIPLWGMIGMTHSALDVISHTDTSSDPQMSVTIEALEYTDTSILAPAIDNPVANIFTDGGDSALYRSMTKFDFRGQKLSLSTELKLLSQAASDALSFASTLSATSGVTDLSPAQLDTLRALTEDMERSELLRNIAAEWISSLAGRWQNGEDFMGMPEPQVPDNTKALIHAFYGYLADTNEARIADDFRCFIDLLDVLSRHDVLDDDQTANFLEKIGNRAFVQDLTVLLDNQDRLRATLADLIASITGAWKNDSDYEGIAVPKTNELFDPVMNTFFGILSTTDENVITDDMTGLSNIIDVLEKYDVFNTQKQGTDMADIFMKSAFVADLNAEINRHPRFVPLLDTVTALGLSAISSQLQVALPDSQTLTDLADSISSALNDVKAMDLAARQDAVDQQVQQVLLRNEIDVPESVAAMIAQITVEKFSEQESISQQDIKDHLLGLYGSAGDLDGFFQ